MGVIGLVSGVLAVAVSIATATPARAAPAASASSSPSSEEAEIAVFFAPADAPAAVTAARDALAARVRELGLAWVDRSPAPAVVPETAQRLRRGVEAYHALRFTDAHAELDAAANELARTGGAGLSTSQLSEVFLYRGLTHAQVGDGAASWDDLVRAATIAPARLLDPAQFSPRTVEAFERARDAVAAADRGELRVDAPDGCTIAIDGVVATAAPALPHGEHYVAVTCAGRHPWGALATLASPTLTVAAAPELDVPPSPQATLELARVRGATGAIALVAAAPSVEGGAAVLTVRRLDAAARVAASTSVELIAGTAAADALAALARVLAPVEVAPPLVTTVAPTRWYRKPWLWAVVGAAAATAIILPFTLGGSDDREVVLRPTGLPW